MNGCVVLLATLLIGAESPESDKAKLQGGWFLTVFAYDGFVTSVHSAPDPDYGFDGDEVLSSGVRAGTFKIDPSKNPKQIDIHFREGFNPATLDVGVYKLEGDTLTICVTKFPDARATDFSCKEGSKRRLCVYKRNPDRPPAPLPPTGDLKKVQGDWYSTTDIEDGKVLRAGPSVRPDFAVYWDNFLLERIPLGGCLMDETKNPKEIKFKYVVGPEQGKILYGIYKLEGDKFTVCTTMDPKTRPKDFSSKPGSKRRLTVYHRKPDR